MKKKSYSEFDRLVRLFNVYIFKRGTEKRIWSYPTVVNDNRLTTSDLLDGYYLDFSRDADYSGLKDANGVPLVDYTGMIGLQYNPFYVGYYALACYEKYRKTLSSGYLENFFAQAEWLSRTAVEKNKKIFAWEYKFQWTRELVPPWISSLAQSLAISVLLRAWLLSKEDRYLDVASSAMLSFGVDVADGGVRYINDEGLLTFQEYAVLPADTVLNGFVFSIWGIMEYWLVTKDSTAKHLMENSTSALAKLLPRYDLGFWSRYNLQSTKTRLPNVASVFYHNVHIAQLRVMDVLFDDENFGKYATIWRGYENNLYKRSLAQLQKVLYKLLAY